MNDALDRWTSRKFWAMMIWQTVITIALWHSKLPVEAFVSLTWLLLGGYFLGNVSQKVLLENVKGKGNVPETPVSVPGP